MGMLLHLEQRSGIHRTTIGPMPAAAALRQIIRFLFHRFLYLLHRPGMQGAAEDVCLQGLRGFPYLKLFCQIPDFPG